MQCVYCNVTDNLNDTKTNIRIQEITSISETTDDKETRIHLESQIKETTFINGEINKFNLKKAAYKLIVT